jgi:hypothetical protein
VTCVDGLLYPTTCGPENCDDPIGDCDDEDNNEIPECLLDCEGIENLDPAHFPDEACDLIISLFGFDPGFNSCISDCDDEVLIAINEIVADCYECLSDATFDCFDVFFNNEEGCYENEEFYCIGCELFISDCDYYECTEEGWEGPFTLDECGEGDGGGCTDGGGLLAYLELEDALGMPGSEVVVPMYLNSPDPVGGVQFKLFNSPGAVPAGINSLDDCFTANYNNLEEAYIGIIFSLEGCNYPANQEVHIADLIFEISPFVPIGVELDLEFDYTIVADSGGNEVLSCGIGANIFLGMLGDVNGDGEINVLDIVAMVNFALGTDYPSDEEFWASDINNDGYVNVLDIVSIVNLILEN